MTRSLVILRPEPGASETAAAARALGIEPVSSPLFVIEPVSWVAPSGAFDAILAGSANAFRHGGEELAQFAGLPVHAVGEATAVAARKEGFAVASVGEAGLQALIDGLSGSARLLRLAGESRVELVCPPEVEMVEAVVYRSAQVPMSTQAVAALGGGAVAMLHSGEAAARFAAECDRLGIDRASIVIAALAPRIADAAGSGWQRVAVAPELTAAALLEMAAAMCQE